MADKRLVSGQSIRDRTSGSGSRDHSTRAKLGANKAPPSESHFDWTGYLLDHVQVAVIAVDMQNAVTYWNRHAEKLYGWSREEALGRNALDIFIVPSDNDRARSVMTALLAAGSWEGKVTVRRKDGTSFSAHVVDTVLRDEDDNAVGLVGVSIDETKRLQERAALEESEARLRSAADLAGLAPYEWNPRTGALLWDDSVKTMWSLPFELHPNIDTFLSGIHPGDRARVDAALSACCDPAGDGLFSEEYRVIGQRDRQQRWVASRGKTFFENGVAVQHVGVTQDITERKRMEEEHKRLLTREREARALAEALRDTAAALNSTLDFDEVMERVLDNAGRVVPDDASVIILLLEGGYWRVVRHRGFVERGLGEWIDGLRIPKSERPALPPGSACWPALTGLPDIQDGPANPQWVTEPEVRWIRSYVSCTDSRQGQT